MSTFELYWTIVGSNGVTQFVESHRMGLYSIDEYLDAISAAGLVVEHDPAGFIGRGLFIGQSS